MKIYIENHTDYLNDYYFKSLCLLYFHSEKFPVEDSSPNTARFILKKEDKGLTAFCEISSPYGKASAECKEEDIVFTIPTPGEEIAKSITGKALLAAGYKLFGFIPPWGHITGLRPVKRARFYLERGFSEKKVRRLFENDHNVSREKTDLSIDTAYNEIKLLSDLENNNCGVYVSIPFCPTRCDYCSFVSYSNQKLFKLIPDYLARLLKDIKKTGEIIRETGFVPSAIYIGGGTPSFLSEEQLEFLLSGINKHIPMENLREFSFEAGRPDTLTKEKLNIINKYGVNRISVNPQTTNQTVLDAIGRKHTVEDFFQAAKLVKKYDFKTVNADIIAGLPKDTFESFSKTLDDVLSLGFENVTVHTLSIKNAAEMKNEEGIFDPAGSLARECVSYVEKTLKAKNYRPYYLYRQKRTVGNGENTGYSLEGHECLYNVMMMEETSSVFACGAGAITKLVSSDGEHIERIAFPKYPFEYLEKEEGIGEERIKSFFAKG